ncbi:entericidin A/B family lipoprotein [Aquirhabdus parva]|uniref:Entericidin, EcnA/B family n=1 Tax=Aquirhabdus parva TaxID=2283318 RepID=A0A345P7T7_9GAMM|nr:entericidin A/B family lipoprotein [Aquirhabdus parva]AXI03346.1 entericidin, EcnA/B family [Aquirhabdus parva]
MIKVIAAAALATMLLTGCNTMKGVGQDVSSAGQAVTGSAEKTQDKL